MNDYNILNPLYSIWHKCGRLPKKLKIRSFSHSKGYALRLLDFTAFHRS